MDITGLMRCVLVSRFWIRVLDRISEGENEYLTGLSILKTKNKHARHCFLTLTLYERLSSNEELMNVFHVTATKSIKVPS